MRNRFALFIAGLGWLGIAAAGSVTAAQAPSKPVEKFVDVGAYRLFFKIIAGRGPVILLESGGGLDSGEWDALAPRLAEATGATVVAYDRAGFGRSDLPESKYDLEGDTADLWRALGRLGLDRDLVLVGHSYGGFLIRYAAGRHPESVRGLVFVDPFTVEFVDALGIDYCNNHPMMGKLPFDASHPETLSKLQRAEVRMAGAPAGNLAEKIEVARGAAAPRGIPARVLVSGTDWLPDAREMRIWRESVRKFAASLDGAKLVVAEKSDHMIPFREPDLVVSAVADIVNPTKSR